MAVFNRIFGGGTLNPFGQQLKNNQSENIWGAFGYSPSDDAWEDQNTQRNVFGGFTEFYRKSMSPLAINYVGNNYNEAFSGYLNAQSQQPDLRFADYLANLDPMKMFYRQSASAAGRGNIFTRSRLLGGGG